MPEPDFGGQEGEEFRGGELSGEGDTADLDAGESDDPNDSGDGGVVVDPSESWTSWSGTLRLERGLTETPGERDCVLSYQMQGVPSVRECDDCLAVFDVQHVIDPAATVDLEACPDAYEAYAATYALMALDDEGLVRVMVGDGAGGFVDLADGSLAVDRLQWTSGEADVPDGSDDEVVYRTAVETVDVWLR
jgi:hypothetical protein